LRTALIRAGFEFRRQHGSHMVLVRRNPPAMLVVPDHRALKTGLLRKLIAQTGLTTEQFLELLR
jgi:predicted RNA binding protein YcfA (HicA-like mRNA interferase family)